MGWTMGSGVRVPATARKPTYVDRNARNGASKGVKHQPAPVCVRQARVVLDTFHGGLLHISPIHLDNLRVSFGEGVGGRPRPLQAAPRRLPSEPDRRGWWLTLTMVGFNTLREFILSICEYRSGKAVAPNRRCRAA